MQMVRTIKLGIAWMLRFVISIMVAVLGIIIVTMGLIIVALENADEV